MLELLQTLERSITENTMRELETLSDVELKNLYSKTFPMSTWEMPRDVMVSVLRNKTDRCTACNSVHTKTYAPDKMKCYECGEQDDLTMYPKD